MKFEELRGNTKLLGVLPEGMTRDGLWTFAQMLGLERTKTGLLTSGLPGLISMALMSQIMMYISEARYSIAEPRPLREEPCAIEDAAEVLVAVLTSRTDFPQCFEVPSYTGMLLEAAKASISNTLADLNELGVQL